MGPIGPYRPMERLWNAYGTPMERLWMTCLGKVGIAEVGG